MPICREGPSTALTTMPWTWLNGVEFIAQDPASTTGISTPTGHDDMTDVSAGSGEICKIVAYVKPLKPLRNHQDES